MMRQHSCIVYETYNTETNNTIDYVGYKRKIC